MPDQSLAVPQVFEPLSIWAECDARARFVVDDNLHISWSNAAGLKLLDTVDIFVAGTGTLTPRSAYQASAFRAFVRGSSDRVSSLCMPCANDDYIICTAINLIGDERPRATGLTLRRASNAVSVGAANLEAAFHLTPAERKIVETLFGGSTAEEIGDRLGLSVGTVRVHIRHIYEKLDVRSREAMFHKLIPFMLVR